MSVAVSVPEQNRGGPSRQQHWQPGDPALVASLELSWKMAELYTLQEEDFQVFRDLCNAFNGLGKSQLDDPFGAEPFQVVCMRTSNSRTIPAFQERPGMRGTPEPCNGPRIFGSPSRAFLLEPQEFIRAGGGRFVCVTATFGQGRRSGLQLSLTAYAVVTVEDDKIRRIAITADRQAALEAAGAAPRNPATP